MAGGNFNYFQYNYMWTEIKEKLQDGIENNPNGYDHFTLEYFKQALHELEKARVYINELDLLFSDDVTEDDFQINIDQALKRAGSEHPDINRSSALTLHSFEEDIIGTVILTNGTFDDVCTVWDQYLSDCLASDNDELDIWDFVNAYAEDLCQVLDLEFYQPNKEDYDER